VERNEKLKPLLEELKQLREEQTILRSQEGGQDKDETRSFSFILVPECGAIEIMVIFLAAVIAFPALWRKRLWGILLGTPIMYCVNIFRLTVLAMMGALWIKARDVFGLISPMNMYGRRFILCSLWQYGFCGLNMW
jgi:exosortase/archaeosortase family protein